VVLLSYRRAAALPVSALSRAARTGARTGGTGSRPRRW